MSQSSPDSKPISGGDEVWRTMTAYLCIAVLWIATHPYGGIVHDARLYAVQALQRLDPQRFADDLFFAFGSQDAFSVFSLVYAPLVGALGSSSAHWVMTVGGHLAWVGALIWLMHTLFGPTRNAWLAAAAVIVLNPHYGAFGILGYGEAFATPRVFAEAFVMTALASVLRAKRLLAVAMLGCGMALHPLMTVPGAAAVFLLLAEQNRRLWIGAVIVGMVAAGLAVLGVEPLARVVRVVDDEWFAIIENRVPYALLSQWGWRSVAETVLPLVGLLFGVLIGSSGERRLIQAVLVVAACGIAAAFLGDSARNLLLLNLQPWRAFWLVALIGNAWAGAAFLRLPDGSVGRHFLLVALACNLLEHWMAAPPFSSAPVALLALLVYLREWRTGRPPSLPFRLLGRGIVVIFLGVLCVMAWFAIPIREGEVGQMALVVSLLLILGALVLLVVVTARVRERATRMAFGLAALLLVPAVLAADQRSRWTRFVEQGRVPTDLSVLFPESATVYWEGGLTLVWFGLRRASHYSCDQGAGIMFYRGTALEYARRTEALHALNTVDVHNDGSGLCHAKAEPNDRGATTAAQLAAACQALPELDVVVLTSTPSGTSSQQWRAPVSMPLRQRRSWSYHDTFHLFWCGDYR